MKLFKSSKNFLLVSFYTVIAVLLLSCRNDNEAIIPRVPVDIYLYEANPDFFELSIVGGWKYVNGGSKGIIVYRKSQTEFMAFDRHCPYQPDDECSKVSVDEQSGILAIDTCCGSQFLLLDGSVSNPPAIYPLKQYYATYDGSVVHITN